MFQRLSIEVTTASGVTVDHQLIAHAAPRGLLIILPGRGYTCDFPVLHYLRKAAADLGYDVLSVWYSFQIVHVPDEQVTMQQLAAEVDQAISEVLKRGYTRVVIAGKSLGTPLAVLHANQAERLILLTPIGTAAQNVRSKPMLAVIGTSDPVYDPDLLDASDKNVQWMVLDDLDHGLEMAGDWDASINALHRITAACVEFLNP